jgi:hypothetical protein
VFIAKELRRFADEVEKLVPGEPVLAFVFFKSGGTVSMALTVKDTDTTTISAVASFTDADGNATTPDDVPVWASSDETVATVSASADGTSCVVTKTGKVGAASISMTSTRSSDGVVVTGADTLTVEPSEATGATVALSAA